MPMFNKLSSKQKILLAIILWAIVFIINGYYFYFNQIKKAKISQKQEFPEEVSSATSTPFFEEIIQSLTVPTTSTSSKPSIIENLSAPKTSKPTTTSEDLIKSLTAPK
ncbi:hypothetical protein COS59_00685 [Candidatus Wolfebacteria bacterium CG03_land_8_20_14_0_80_36_15]|uniref:Uncharacterized protein n=1 Tax=Candidatus Wolfebacteria bacterium CG03_land_8_20_14_0_80_36_15 TaxID=1975067 RepID=A0A2M7B842_9BACT|nr:MAG: hypothetical protein COS59_00685 [Candidatus Wolfebacteria bacterium CG03_land_8_20_14_0_80_36_15]